MFVAGSAAATQAILAEGYAGQQANQKWCVTAKLPERDGAFEYRIRSISETHERLARESELQAMSEAATEPANPIGEPRR
jgi:hypothetical protein